jgi:hypothetical protein
MKEGARSRAGERRGEGVTGLVGAPGVAGDALGELVDRRRRRRRHRGREASGKARGGARGGYENGGRRGREEVVEWRRSQAKGRCCLVCKWAKTRIRMGARKHGPPNIGSSEGPPSAHSNAAI